MPSDFTKALIAAAKYWPTLYFCRADILSHMFCTIGSGLNWVDGRLSDGMRTRSQRERYFAELEANSALTAQYDIERYKVRLEAAKTDKERAMFRRFIEVANHEPRSPRTDDEALAVVNNWGHPDDSCEAWAKPHRKKERAQGHTVFYPLSEDYARCFVVPDDVRPDWLVGIGECLDMIIKWDLPPNVELAHKAKAKLVERFGPEAQWSKRKRNPSPPKIIPSRDVVGRAVRVDFGDERSWGEHRPDLGPAVYRSLNDTLSDVKLKLPEDFPDQDAVKRNGKPCNMRWGHLFVGTERELGNVIPKYIIGIDKTPTDECGKGM